MIHPPATGLATSSGSRCVDNDSARVPALASYGGRSVEPLVASASETSGRLVLAAEPEPVPPSGPPAGSSSEAVMTWLGQPLPINYYATGRSPLEGLVPLPRQLLTGAELKDDEWLLKTCQGPYSLEEFQEWIELRKAAEACRQEFCFTPLRTTLCNMLRFIAHIRDGKQFHDPLTEKEDQALAWCQVRAKELFDAGAPYKRTVRLAMALLVLCEIVTDRQVLGPLLEQGGAATARHLRRMTEWSRHAQRLADGGDGKEFPAALLDPAFVASLYWGGNNRQGPNEAGLLFGDHPCHLNEALFHRLHDQHLLIYPSFQEVDIEHFCKAGHLPLHIVGMTTHYALNADGQMMSPFMFASHDLGHMRSLITIGEPEYQHKTGAQWLWTQPCQRLQWRRLLLDSLPACLAPLNMKRALELQVFENLHEVPARHATYDFLKGSSAAFVSCLLDLLITLRKNKNGLAPCYQDVTDTETAMAALWSLRVWQCWQAENDNRSVADRLHDCAMAFLGSDVPQLRQHLAFVADNWAVLRQLFADSRDLEPDKDGQVEVRCAPEFYNQRSSDQLFRVFPREKRPVPSGLHGPDLFFGTSVAGHDLQAGQPLW